MAAGILIGMPVCAQEEPISDGVFIGDKNVSGMMPDEAAQYVKNEVATLGSTTVTITMGSQQTSATFRELGFSWKIRIWWMRSARSVQVEISSSAIKSRKICRMKSAHYEIEYTMDESMEAEVCKIPAASLIQILWKVRCTWETMGIHMWKAVRTA